MKLGILITTERHLPQVLGLTRSALSKGHEVLMFIMDDGVRLLENPSFTQLCKLNGISMAYCDYNANARGIDRSVIPAGIISGSQLNNAQMFHNADRVINL